MADHHNHRDGFDDLDTLFAEARATRPEVPDRLMQAILADAATEQGERLRGIEVSSRCVPCPPQLPAAEQREQKAKKGVAALRLGTTTQPLLQITTLENNTCWENQ